MLRSFYGIMSPLFAIAGFIAGIANAQIGVLLMLGAILFQLWSKDGEK